LQHENSSVTPEELFRRCGFRMARAGLKGNHAMSRKQTRENNLIELAAIQRERKLELGRTDRAPKRACRHLDEAAEVENSPLHQLLSILDGRRGH
jgi:hypothetical protein